MRFYLLYTKRSVFCLIYLLLSCAIVSGCDSKVSSKMNEAKSRPNAIAMAFSEALFSGASIEQISPYVSDEFKQNILSYGTPKQYARIMLDISLDNNVEVSTHIFQQTIQNGTHTNLSEVSVVIVIKGELQGVSRNSIKIAKLRNFNESWRIYAIEHPSFDLQRRFGISNHY